jgi:hypothetical protein
LSKFANKFSTFPLPRLQGEAEKAEQQARAARAVGFVIQRIAVIAMRELATYTQDCLKTVIPIQKGMLSSIVQKNCKATLEAMSIHDTS